MKADGNRTNGDSFIFNSTIEASDSAISVSRVVASHVIDSLTFPETGRSVSLGQKSARLVPYFEFTFDGVATATSKSHPSHGILAIHPPLLTEKLFRISTNQ